MELANGTEPDGIKFRVYLEAPYWVAEVTHPDGRASAEKWQWAFPPRCGPDVADTAKANDVLERLIADMRSNA